MAIFEEREKGFEEKFAHDEELQFRVVARRNRLLGLWVAEKMGLTGADAEAYAMDVVASDLDRNGDETVFDRIRGDMHSSGLEISEKRVRSQMQELIDEAHKQIKAE